MSNDLLPGGVIRWEDPPPPNWSAPRTRPRPWALIAAQLKARPGEWGVIDEGGQPTMQSRIRRGESWFAPRGAFEAAVRDVNGVVTLWARYVGEPPTT
jgi:hypothetical protein